MKLELETLTDTQQTRLCELCELYVYCQRVNTDPHNLCEGSRCDEAIEYLEEELIEERYQKMKYLRLLLK